MYVAVMLLRSGDVFRKFQLLSGVFREHPSYITQNSLEMLYRRRGFDIIQNYKASLYPYFVLSLIRQESAFNNRARSPAGALGLMQLMPQTARRLEHRVSKWPIQARADP